jgi:hypothetical protein
MALQDRFETIKKNDPERYKYVIANILLAKQVLKEAHVYKPERKDSSQGGLGGVGIENWILQNGGSFTDAAKSFLEAAKKAKSFQEFKEIYPIWDFGENHYVGKKEDLYSHDNFVDNMNESGYEKMCTALSKYLELALELEECNNSKILNQEEIITQSLVA